MNFAMKSEASRGRGPPPEEPLLTEEEKAELQALAEERARQEQRAQENGPPPNLAKRELIFDSLLKVVEHGYRKGGESQGTYVWTFGAGYAGQLGREFARGKQKHATVPQLVKLDAPVRLLACGAAHTVALTDSGAVYVWGDGQRFQLGRKLTGATSQPTPQPLRGTSLDVQNVVKAACGRYHTVVITAQRKVFSWGYPTEAGETGVGKRLGEPSVRLVEFEEGHRAPEFVAVSCGEKHTALLSADGQVFTFGSNQQGQLGLGLGPGPSGDGQTPVDRYRPTLVSALSGVPIVSISCGPIHSSFISATGQLYICGFGEGLYPDGSNFKYEPFLIPLKEKAVQAASGQSHILVRTDRGDVYSWGSCSRGELGYGIPKAYCNVPRLILSGKRIQQVASGRYHCVALTAAGVVYSWGSGEGGTGHGDDCDVCLPKVVEGLLGSVVGQVACGEHHTAALSSTPWQRLHPEVEELLRYERQEYALKKSRVHPSNRHGLTKKDLLEVEREMAEWLREQRKDAMRRRQAEEEEAKTEVAHLALSSDAAPLALPAPDTDRKVGGCLPEGLI